MVHTMRIPGTFGNGGFRREQVGRFAL